MSEDRLRELLRDAAAGADDGARPGAPLARVRDRINRARRRRRRAVSGVAVAAVVAAVVALVALPAIRGHRSGATAGRPGAAEVTVQSPADARFAIHGARITQAMAFDDKLILAPATTPPKVSERRAIALARSVAGPGAHVEASHVVVAYGLATLLLPVTPQSGQVVPQQLPNFKQRPVWMVLYQPAPFNCLRPGSPAPATSGPAEAQMRVTLVAADSSGEGVTYTSAGLKCGQHQAPVAHPASYIVSVPWQITQTTKTELTVRGSVPACAYPVDASRTGPGRSIAVTVRQLMVRGPCTAQHQHSTWTVPRPSTGTVPAHAPTGLQPALVTRLGRGAAGASFTYTDGSTHTIR